jgi:Caspase domain
MDTSQLIRHGDLWAVLIGVNEYDDPEWGPLPYCAKDVAGLAALFIDPTRGGYPASNIRVLVNSAKKRSLKPTRGNILAAVNHLASIADRQDTILFGFFGHGLDIDGVSYLFPSDGFQAHPHDTAIELKWVQDTLQHSKAQVKLLVFDACHSGALRGRSGAGRMSQIFAQWLFEELVKSEGWAVLSSCKQDELSHDYDEKEHGVFTYYFLEGLSGAADTNADGLITVYEASQYATLHTKRWAFENGVQQTPELQWNVTGDLVLIKSKINHIHHELRPLRRPNDWPDPWTPRAVRIGLEYGVLIDQDETVTLSPAFVRRLREIGREAVVKNYTAFLDDGLPMLCKRAILRVHPGGNIFEEDLEYFTDQLFPRVLNHLIQQAVSYGLFREKSTGITLSEEFKQEFAFVHAQTAATVHDSKQVTAETLLKLCKATILAKGDSDASDPSLLGLSLYVYLKARGILSEIEALPPLIE